MLLLLLLCLVSGNIVRLTPSEAGAATYSRYVSNYEIQKHMNSENTLKSY